MPRAALLSIHARVEATAPATWEAPSLVQLWGPRYSAYVVSARDLAPFSLGMPPNSLRYGATTGTIVMRWDGARQPTIWTVPRPEADARDARLELACRYLHIFGPGTPEAFAEWAGISVRWG